MGKYDYRDALCEDIREYLKYNGVNVTTSNRDEIEQKLNEELWVHDSVTGNGSGSYTFNAWEAEENLCHNWDLLEDALSAFGSDINPIEKGAEWCDVTIRCYLLGECISHILDEVEQDDEIEDDEFDEYYE